MKKIVIAMKTETKTLVITVAYYAAKEGGFCAEAVGGIGCYSQGRTISHARSMICDVLVDILELAPDQLPKGPRKPKDKPDFIETIVLVKS